MMVATPISSIVMVVSSTEAMEELVYVNAPSLLEMGGVKENDRSLEKGWDGMMKLPNVGIAFRTVNVRSTVQE